MSLPTKSIRVLLALPVIAMAASWPALAETDGRLAPTTRRFTAPIRSPTATRSMPAWSGR